MRKISTYIKFWINERSPSVVIDIMQDEASSVLFITMMKNVHTGVFLSSLTNQDISQ